MAANEEARSRRGRWQEQETPGSEPFLFGSGLHDGMSLTGADVSYHDAMLRMTLMLICVPSTPES